MAPEPMKKSTGIELKVVLSGLMQVQEFKLKLKQMTYEEFFSFQDNYSTNPEC